METLSLVIELLILVVVTFETVFLLWQHFKQREPNLNCDNCKNLRYLEQTPDNAYWLCEECMGAYLAERFSELKE